MALPSLAAEIDVAPAVAFARPQEPATLVHPAHRVHDIEPGLGAVAEDSRDDAGCRIGREQVLLVLQPVELLEGERRGVAPLEPRQVGVTWIARRRHPPRVAPLGIDHADPCRRVGGAGLGIRDARGHRIDGVGGVQEGEDADPGRVELPVGDPAAVGAPAEAVAHPEFLFVDPVRGAVDDRLGARRRQRRDAAPFDRLDVEIVGPHVGDARAVGRELREHERCRRGTASELCQAAGRQIEHPVVAARVLPPDPGGVREDQQAPAIGRPGVVGDVERCRLARGHEPGARDEHRARAGRRVVAHQVGAPGRPRGLDGRIGRAVGHPARRAEGRHIVGAVLEDTPELDVEGRAVEALREQQVPAEGDPGGDEQIPHARCGRHAPSGDRHGGYRVVPRSTGSRRTTGVGLPSRSSVAR